MSKKIGVSEKSIDLVEIGKGGQYGQTAGKMLDYFGVRIKLDLVKHVSEDENIVINVSATPPEVSVLEKQETNPIQD